MESIQFHEPLQRPWDLSVKEGLDNQFRDHDQEQSGRREGRQNAPQTPTPDFSGRSGRDGRGPLCRPLQKVPQCVLVLQWAVGRQRGANDAGVPGMYLGE